MELEVELKFSGVRSRVPVRVRVSEVNFLPRPHRDLNYRLNQKIAEFPFAIESEFSFPLRLFVPSSLGSSCSNPGKCSQNFGKVEVGTPEYALWDNV